MDRAEIAHVDPDDQRWFSVSTGWSNVTVCCRACNTDHGHTHLRAFGLAAIVIEQRHVDASVAEFERRQQAGQSEQDRRAHARDRARAQRRASQLQPAPHEPIASQLHLALDVLAR